MKTMHTAADRRAIAARIGRLAPDSQPQWGKFTAPRMVVQPVFGPMSTRAWGVLVYRHCDHHLRQFRV